MLVYDPTKSGTARAQDPRTDVGGPDEALFTFAEDMDLVLGQLLRRRRSLTIATERQIITAAMNTKLTRSTSSVSSR